jgi:hypothetical protein
MPITGTVDTTTALTDAYSAFDFRSAVSVDGNQFWLTGAGEGVRYAAGLGTTTSTLLSGGAPSNVRVIGIYDSQVYTSSASGAFLGVAALGTGLPTSSGQTTTLLPGFPVAGGPTAGSTYDYFFADPSTVYVADDNAPASTIGGVSKWTFSTVTNTWSRAYRITVQPTPTTNWGARGLSGYVQNGVTTLYATMNSPTATVLCSIVDTGPASTVTQLVTAPAGNAFRGVRFLAQPTTVARIPAGCGPDIKVNGNAQIGTDVRTTLLNPLGFPFIGYGTTPLGVPALPGCSCLVGHDFAVLLGGNVSTISIPNNPSLNGALVLVQGLDAFAPGPCFSPIPLSLTDYFSFTVQL